MLRQTLFGALLLPALASAGKCRCRPSDACWPAAAEWDSFNSTVDGNLVAVRPVGEPCHDPTYNEDVCGDIMTLRNDSLWLASQPGALQFQNWAARPSTKESCYIAEDRDVKCGQGRISLFSVVAQSAKHIQAAVKFAAKFDIRLAIKNSGHCFLGRSSAPESLQILTTNLKSIDFVDDFVPKGAKESVGSAVTIGAGVALKKLYEALWEKELVAIIGSAHTVGAAGGYIQGGGHSLLSPWGGMASDNALEFEVVTADGNIVTANEHTNADLFWALRGGGGGTFGVVTSATLRTYVDPPCIFASVSLNTTDDDAYWRTIERLHTHLPAINNRDGGGYYFMDPSTSSIGPPNAAAPSSKLSSLRAFFLFANQTDQDSIDALFAPLLSEMNEAVGKDSVAYISAAAPQTKYIYEVLIPAQADDLGTHIVLGSRLISHDFISSPSGPAALTDVFKTIAPLGGTILGHVVSGGQTRNSHIDSAIHPAWRRTLTHIVVSNGWDATAPWEYQDHVRDVMTNQQVAPLRELEPDMGAYLNEADPNEVDFQQSFWGENYERLTKIKAKWDPKGLFIARKGVASEQWDEDGLCRV